MPYLVNDANIILLDDPLEPRSLKESSVQLPHIKTASSISSLERQVLDRKIELIVASGANVVISASAIDTYSLSRLAKANIYALRHVRSVSYTSKYPLTFRM
jgi:chaperonin GroEL (HSP60 family)